MEVDGLRCHWDIDNNRCGVCGESWGIRWVKDLTEQEAGVIIVATMLVFPTTLLIYGGAKLVFAAKQAADRKLREDRKRIREEGRKEGIKEGREEGHEEGLKKGHTQGLTQGFMQGLTQGHTEERNRIREELERSGKLTPELARILGGEDDEADSRP